jgi:putative sigma-54 modulation protein
MEELMQVSVTFRNIDATDALKEYAREKIGRLQKYLNRPMDAHVILFKERFRHVAEILVTANGVPLKCLARDQDMYAAIDAALDKADRQLRKFKERVKDHRPPEARRGPRRALRARHIARPLPEELPREEPPGPVLVPTDEVASRPLTPEQAVEELEARGASVLLFRHARSKRPGVVYRRPDGTYGWVEWSTRKKQATGGGRP